MACSVAYAAMIGYSYKTVRTQKASENPSPYIIEKIEEVFKKELLDDAEKKPLKDYPGDQQADNPTYKEDQIPYGDKKKVVSKLELFHDNLKKLTAEVGEFLKGIKDEENGNEQLKETPLSEPSEEVSKPASILHKSDQTTFYPKAKRKPKKKDTDQSAPPDEPAK